VLGSACAHPARPTVTGAELYARIGALRDAGEVTIGAVSVRKSQVLVTGRQGQAFYVEQVIESCRGGDPAADVDCTLALLLDQRFTVHDRMPTLKGTKAEREDRSRSLLTSLVVVGAFVAIAGGLGYGVATCEFPGCKAVFGVPLVLIGGSALFLLGRD
jgi:hypothetical protein